MSHKDDRQALDRFAAELQALLAARFARPLSPVRDADERIGLIFPAECGVIDSAPGSSFEVAEAHPARPRTSPPGGAHRR